MVVLFVLGGVGVARPSLLEMLPDLDWDLRDALELFDHVAEPSSASAEGTPGRALARP